MRGLLLSLALALPLLGACAPSLPPEFEAGTSCWVDTLGAVHLTYRADCSCVSQLALLARQVLAAGGVVPSTATLSATVWVYSEPPTKEGVTYAGWYVRAADGGPAVILDAPMDALAHELVHAWRLEHEGVALEAEVAHRGWDATPGGRPSLWQVTGAYQDAVASAPPCQLEP